MGKIKLRDFVIEESSNLALIDQQLKSFNIFDVLNISHREIRHSNFIGWLIDPNGNHGFGEYFLLQFLNNLPDITDEALIEYNINSLSGTSVERESQNNIDIFLINHQLSFTITIENKIYASDHSGQLEEYHRHVEERFEGIDKNYFIYLTPFGSIPNDQNMRDIYQCFSYKQLVSIIEKGLEEFENIDATIRNSIDQYVDNVKRNILNMDDTTKIAQKIYQKHQAAIDFIVKSKPDLSSIFIKAKKYVVESEKLILLTPEDKKFIRFLTCNEDFNRSIEFPKARSWRCPYIFAFELHFQGDKINLKLCFGRINPENEADYEFLQSEKFRLFEKMKILKSIKKIVSKRSKSSSRYPAIAWQEIITIQHFWDDESDKMIDVFKNRFETVVKDVILPFVEEFNEV